MDGGAGKIWEATPGAGGAGGEDTPGRGTRGGLVMGVVLGGQVECAERWLCFFSSRRRHTRCSRDWSSDGALPILARSTNPLSPSASNAISRVVLSGANIY